MNKKKLVVVIVILAVAAIVVFIALRVSRSNNETIRVSGNIEVTSVELSFKIPGRVSERLVDEGDLVNAGQIVARIDPEDIRHEVESRQATVAAARAALSELEAGYRKEEIAQAEAVLGRVSAEAKRISTDFARQKELFRKEVISARDFDASQAAYESSQASVREAMARLNLLQSGPRKETIEQARARLRDAQAVLALAETRLGYATLTSPTAGLVLSKNIEPGEQVAAGTPVVTVGMLNEVWVRAYISETDLGRVKAGQAATVTTDTWPGKACQGHVSFIAQEAEFTPKSVQTAKERVRLVYRIKVVIPNRDGELKPGMPVDVEIMTEKQNSRDNSQKSEENRQTPEQQPPG